MKFSYTTLLDYPLADSLSHIKTADENGYYACYAADETWHKDLWLLYAAAADKTKNVRFGPNLSSVYLREPTLICQALATLDARKQLERLASAEETEDAKAALARVRKRSKR